MANRSCQIHILAKVNFREIKNSKYVETYASITSFTFPTILINYFLKVEKIAQLILRF